MKTIDILILETLANGKVTTAQELSETWGEDRTRIYGWLAKFSKLGLCTQRAIPGRGRNPGTLAYLGNKKRIAEYLRTRTNGIAH